MKSSQNAAAGVSRSRGLSNQPSLQSSSSRYSCDSWKIRHMLISLRLFQLNRLYEVVCEIAQDAQSKGAKLNLEDRGWDECVFSCGEEDIHMAKKWFAENLDQCQLWVPSLGDLLYAKTNRSAKVHQLLGPGHDKDAFEVRNAVKNF